MLYQDTLTGMLHEVPDSQVAGWGLAEDPYGVGEAYDGLGYPLGWGPKKGWGLRKAFRGLIKRAVPLAMSMSPYGQIISRALPIARRALAPVIASTGEALRQQAMQQLAPPVAPVASVAPVMAPVAESQLSGMAAPVTPVAVPGPAVAPAVAAPIAPMGQRLPVGWRRPPVPYTGLRPRRVYLRCSVWPGPRGLVPVSAAAATPAGPAVVVPPVVVGGPVRYRGRGRRR
jgi:hypothetical protein